MIVAIADDITGAAEIAGACLRLGVPVSFSLDIHPIDKGVLVLATDTRSLGVEEAIVETRNIANRLFELGVKDVFKKTDSVLRGHVAQELETLAGVFGREKVLLSPTNPYTDRRVAKGKYYVKDVPLDMTDFGDDPEFPAFTSSVKELLRPLSMKVHAGNGIEALVGSRGITLPDALDMGELMGIAQEIDEDIFPAGSGAFFEAFLRVKFSHLCATDKKSSPKPLEGKGILVAGSNHFQTHAFIKNAINHGIKVSEMPRMLKIQEIHASKMAEWKEDVQFLLRSSNKLIITLGKIQVRFDNCANVLKERMAQTVVAAIQEEGVDELMVSGGATVFAIISRLNWREFIPLEELSPGVVRLKEESTGCYLTIKPGSYNWPEEIIEFFDISCYNA
ncbi:four-carbon acid sugar kinase family protein [Pleomorphovibrio marinus]|uniref:four-carbon acid sugar kinase family protein n=1 Tax=Pleomorphovibrio marinus TaxID=2164132 RepID=UPI000E0B6CB7|nr:four-carbon acid sugar kinase family protein [Pleomorphovibrio marinus]